MRPLITVTAVVLLHLCVIAVLVGVNGCRSTTGLETDGEPVAYASGGRVGVATPAPVAGLPLSTLAPAPVSTTTPRLATPAPTKVTPITAVGAGGVHVVVKGEGLIIVAAREKVSVKDLCAANGLTLNANLQPGQKLKIPGPGTAAGKTTVSPPRSAPGAKPATSPAPAIDFAPLKLAPVGTQPAAPVSDAPAAVPAKK